MTIRGQIKTAAIPAIPGTQYAIHGNLEFQIAFYNL